MTTDALQAVPLDSRLGSAPMEGSPNAPGATPEGVRRGDRAALQAVVDRRGPAVIAFCTQVCGPQDAARAAAEAFARFRAAVRDAPDLAAVDPEPLLRGATRHAAASMARVPLGPPPHGRLRSRGTQTCERVPIMLAARANGALGDADLERLARHLDRCERCDALGEIFHRAELGYQDPPFDTLGTDISDVLLDALQAVPMQTIGVAPAPAPDGAGVPVQDGAFGHLPDLEDEIPLVVEPDTTEDVARPQDAERDEDREDAADGEAEDPDDEPSEAAAAVVTAPAPRRRRGVRAALALLPMLVVAATAAAVLFFSGVLGGDDPTPPAGSRPPAGIERPVLTPLPVTAAATSSTAASTGATQP